MASPEEIAGAVGRLRAGGIVAFPTETVYGLGADAFNVHAVARVFGLKGRPPGNPMIVHVYGEEMARRVAAPDAWSTDAAALASAFWPGPLTIVVRKSAALPAIVTAGAPTVAVRAPDHHVALALIAGLGSPIVGPSANPSGRISPTTAAHVREAFGEADVLVLDGGPCRGGIESTVVSLAGPAARVLRLGLVTGAEIGRVLGRPVEIAPPGEAAAADAPAPSPGMQERHYAPRTPAVLFAPDQWPRALTVRRAAVLSSRSLTPPLHPPHVLIRMPADAAAYAARLYAALREADELGADLIAIERPPDSGPVWDAIRDRLARATSPERRV
jgi:L-threonylcarbamoyladenylate synthase